ncbi:MAG: OmpA family protein [Robiginitomaculum sp.]|nr:OmpA family protein [Robiginitomaculum sp.]
MVTDAKMCPPKIVTPPPPPVVVPPTVTHSVCDTGATNFVVYFPWDKSALTDQAKAVILNATNIANQCSISDIVIEGHADSSGAASYNVGLSHRRADNVEGELRRNGLTTSNVTKTARGETALAVGTGDGVREPLNRRTEVIIRLIPTNNFTQ